MFLTYVKVFKTTLSMNWREHMVCGLWYFGLTTLSGSEFIRFLFSQFLNPNTLTRIVNLKTFYASGCTHVSTQKKIIHLFR